MEYVPTIGLEVHAELQTKSKMFCDSKNDPEETHPNIHICPVCLGHPGTLPVINMEAVKKVLLVGFALHGTVATYAEFDRKNYFYPDLPKGYQISQYKYPLVVEGMLPLPIGKSIRIARIHLEEDTGSIIHDEEGASLVDFNRAGVPLMELVSEPDVSSAEEACMFAQELQLILRYLGVSRARMERGEMRVEANVSVARKGEGLGTKVEIKNLNSFKSVERAVAYEVLRQESLLRSGGKVVQETRGWDERAQKTVSQRAKEEAHDYRYFPEPDLPPLKFTLAQIELIKDGLVELPSQRRVRFARYGLNDTQIEIFTVARHLGDYYEHVATELDSVAKDFHIKKRLKGEFPNEPHLGRRLHELSANYIITEFPVLMSAKGLEIDDLEGFKISSEAFAELMVLIFHKELSSTGAKAVLKEMAETGLHPEQIMKEKNLGQMSDASELETTVDKAVANNEQAVEDYKKGKEASLKFLIGIVMRDSKGRANPQMVEEILKNKLK